MDLVSTTLHRIRASQAGEGVISTAIAVLIMAVIGAGMFIAFNDVFDDASETIEDRVGEIERD